MEFSVVTPDPAAWLHVRAFDEAADAIHAGLLQLGHASVRVKDQWRRSSTGVLFGSHLLRAGIELPPETILFNLEQIVPGALFVKQSYFEHLSRHRVWDYSGRNVAALRELGLKNVCHVPLGHAPSLERIGAAPEDIDVLFYGIYTDKRLSLLARIAGRGVRVAHTRSQYGAERDALIARARVVINVHLYEPARFEVARCFYLLANGRFVLSEASEDAAEQGFGEGLAFARYEDMEEACLWHLRHPQEREAIARRGRELMRARPQGPLLAPAVEAL